MNPDQQSYRVLSTSNPFLFSLLFLNEFLGLYVNVQPVYKFIKIASIIHSPLIYRILHPSHQMNKVERKEVVKDDRLEKTEAETNHGDHECTPHEEHDKGGRKKEKSRDYDTYEIDHKMLPFIFRFNYAALQRLKMKKSPHIPKLAIDIFEYLKDKLIVRRYSEGGKYPNRMKYEEKVKFLMRAFDHRRGSSAPPADAPKRKEKFNRQKQLEFFTRPDVRENFLEEIADALERKKAQNQRRIKDIEDCIEMALSFLSTDPAKAERVFQQRIKRKQLPWTDNMFQDIEEFSKQLFSRFSAENIEAERQAIQQQNSKSEHNHQERREEDESEMDGSALGEDSAVGDQQRRSKQESRPKYEG